MTNESKIWPIEYNVVVAPTEVKEKTAGGIIIPDATKERDQFAQMEGVLVAVSPFAFSYENASAWAEVGVEKPKPGERVLFAKYSGAVVKGRDGKDYRILKDKDVSAVLA